MNIPIGVIIAQWGVLLVLGALVVIAFRQLAVLLEVNAPVSQGGPELNKSVAPFSYRDLNGTGGTFNPETPGTKLLMFTDPRCGACNDALDVLESSVVSKLAEGVDMLLVTDSDPQSLAANERLARTALTLAIVEPKVLSKLYRVSATPLVVGIDDGGVARVKSAGITMARLKPLLKEIRTARAAVDVSEAEINKPSYK